MLTEDEVEPGAGASRPMSLRAGLQVTVNGLEERAALEIGNAVAALVRSLSANLDLSGLERVIITTAYDEDLAALDRGDSSPEPMTATRNRHGGGMAMTPSVRRGDEWLSIVIIHASLMLGLISEDEMEQRRSAQVVIHELAHADDHRVMAARWPGFLQPHVDKYELALITLVEKARSEYVATRLAALAFPDAGSDLMKILVDVVNNEPAEMAADVEKYQNHRDIGLLWQQVIKRVGLFMQAAGYVLGHLDGLNDDDPNASLMAESLKELGFTAWGRLLPELHVVIAELSDTPAPWSGWANYEPSARIVLSVLDLMKVHPLRHGSSGLWIKIAP